MKRTGRKWGRKGTQNGEFNINTGTPQSSLNALNGIHTDQAMTVIDKCNNKSQHILAGSGSTHNFLDFSTAKKLHCDIKKMPRLQVVVANGHQMQCNYGCIDFTWILLGEEFNTYVILMPLGSCEMVLQVQWISSFGALLWDFGKFKVEFNHRGTRIVLGAIWKSNLEWMGRKKIQHSTLKSA